MKKSTIRVTLVCICLLIGVVAYYAYLSGKTQDARKEAALTAAQKVLSRDLGKDYPPTPKEVIKYYNEILKCFYNEECSTDEIADLGEQARLLYDADLLEANQQEEYQLRLQADVADYKANNRRIASTSVAASTSVDYFEEEGFSFARIHCGYNVMEGKSNTLVSQVYLLRRDEDKKWKIYGWDLAENVNPGVNIAGE